MYFFFFFFGSIYLVVQVSTFILSIGVQTHIHMDVYIFVLYRYISWVVRTAKDFWFTNEEEEETKKLHFALVAHLRSKADAGCILRPPNTTNSHFIHPHMISQYFSFSFNFFFFSTSCLPLSYSWPLLFLYFFFFFLSYDFMFRCTYMYLQLGTSIIRFLTSFWYKSLRNHVSLLMKIKWNGWGIFLLRKLKIGR